MALFPVSRNGRWGYIDEGGRVCIPFEFLAAEPFIEGLARVTIPDDISRFGAEAFIDSSGNVAIGPGPPSDATSIVKWVDNWNEFRPLDCEPAWTYGDFHFGRATFRVHASAFSWCGFIDTKGELAVPVRYRDASEFSGGMAFVQKTSTSDNVGGFINTHGDFVIDDLSVEPYWGAFRESRCRVGLLDGQGDYTYGFIDSFGDVVIEPAYTNAKDFSEGLCAVTVGESESRRVGFLTHDGTTALDFQFEQATSFHQGLAYVTREGIGEIIDADGTRQAVAKLDPKTCDVESFSEGFALVYGQDKGNDFVGFLDHGGNLAFRFNQAEPFCDGLALVTRGNETGYIDKTGEFVWTTDNW